MFLAELVPAIHIFDLTPDLRRGCPAQGRHDEWESGAVGITGADQKNGLRIPSEAAQTANSYSTYEVGTKAYGDPLAAAVCFEPAGKTRSIAIMPRSSCPRMWQWKTKSPMSIPRKSTST